MKPPETARVSHSKVWKASMPRPFVDRRPTVTHLSPLKPLVSVGMDLGNQEMQEHIFGDIIKRQVVGEARVNF